MNKPKGREWSRDDVIKLIEMYECNPCLWDCRDADYKNKVKKNAVFTTIAKEFSTTTEEVTRKLHNLRSQWQNELKKLQVKKSGSGANEVYKCNGWCFESLKFLDVGSASTADTLGSSVTISSEISEENQNSVTHDNEFQRPTRTAKKRKDEDILSKCTKILSDLNDDDQIFGEYVASVLRSFSSKSNKKLRRIIQKAIVDIQDEEDFLTAEATSSRSSSSQSVNLDVPVYSPMSQVPDGNQVNTYGINNNEQFFHSVNINLEKQPAHESTQCIDNLPSLGSIYHTT